MGEQDSEVDLNVEQWDHMTAVELMTITMCCCRISEVLCYSFKEALRVET